MRTANYLLPIALCLLASTAQAGIEIIPPAEQAQPGVPVALEIRGLADGDGARSVVICYPAANTKVLGPIEIGGKFYLCFQAADTGRRFVAIASTQTSEGPPVVGSILIDVGGESPPPPPPDDLATQAVKWLDGAWLDGVQLPGVPQAARDEPVDDPLSEGTMTRQQAVGATFSAVGRAAKSLGSIAATNVMLTTGLASSFGDRADDWLPFATAGNAALEVIEQSGVSAEEYGEALQTIGEALK